MPDEPKNRLRIGVGLLCCDRPFVSSHTFQSILMQTHRPDKIVVLENSNSMVRIYNDPTWGVLLATAAEMGVEAVVVNVVGKGMAEGRAHLETYMEDCDIVWMSDDDHLYGPTYLHDCLKRLKVVSPKQAGVTGGYVVSAMSEDPVPSFSEFVDGATKLEFVSGGTFVYHREPMRGLWDETYRYTADLGEDRIWIKLAQMRGAKFLDGVGYVADLSVYWTRKYDAGEVLLKMLAKHGKLELKTAEDK